MSAADATLRLLLVGVDKGASKLFGQVGHEAQGAAGKTSHFKAATVAGLAAAGAAVVAFGKKSVDAYTDAAKESAMLARVTGLTVKESSRLRFAAEESGVEFNTLSTSTRIFSKNLVAAGSSTKKMADLTKQLGFSVKDAHGHLLPMSELLPKVADRFKSMPDGPEKTALAMKLFGRSGADMIKILNKGSEGLRELGQESDRTGNTLSNVDGYKKTLQAQREFHAATQGLQVQLGAALFPILTQLALFLTTHVAPAIAAVTHFVTEHQAAISHIAPIIAIVVGAFAGLVGILKVVNSVMAGVNLIMAANPFVLVAVALVALGVALVVAYKKSETFRDIVNAAFHAVGDALTAVWNHILAPVFEFWGKAIGLQLLLWGKLMQVIGNVPGFGWVGDLGDKLVGAAHAAMNLNLALDQATKDRTANITIKYNQQQVMGAPSISKPRVPHSAVGARWTDAGPMWVGERGPEILDLPRGSSVTPVSQLPGGAGAVGGDLGTLTVVVRTETGEVLEQKLAKLKRTRGGATLAFV